MRRRDILTASGLLALSAGCGPLASARRRGTSRLRVATAREIARIGLAGGAGSESTNVAMLIFDSLVTLDESLNVRSRLAHEWFQSSETEWTFKLNGGVRFSNGEACDAAAVAYTVHRIATMVPSYSYKNQWGRAWPPTARVIDPLTVAIATREPRVTLPRLLCRIAIVPPLASQKPDSANNPIGSGPYTLASWNRGGDIALKANTEYFRGRPPIDELVWSSIGNPAARVVALRAGDVDLIWDVPAERRSIIRDDDRLKVMEFQSIGLAFITFNFRAMTSPIANPTVRRALTYAIDAKGIRDELMNGEGELGRGPAPSLVIGSVDAGGYPARDVARARRILADAGYPNGLDLVLIFEAGNFENDQDVCTAIVAQLAEAGVRVRFEELPPGGMNQRRKRTDWDLAPNSVPGSFTGEAGYHYYQLKTQQGFSSAPVEGLLDKADRVNSPDRVQQIQQAMRLMWAQTPYLWSLGIARTFGADRQLAGLQYIPINWLDFLNTRI